MAWQIERIRVDGVVFTGCRHTLDTNTDPEVAVEGVAEATVSAAGIGSGTITETVVASPTTSPNVGPLREGIDYSPRGKMDRCAVCGWVYHTKEMVRATGRRAGVGSLVCRDCYDEVMPQIRVGMPRRTGGS